MILILLIFFISRNLKLKLKKIDFIQLLCYNNSMKNNKGDKKMELKIKEIINSNFAIKSEKSFFLAKEIKNQSKEKEIILNFDGIESSTTRFFTECFKELDSNLFKKIKIKNSNHFIDNQIEVAKNLLFLNFN